MRIFITLPALALLAACQDTAPAAPDPAPAPAPAAACDEASLQEFVGGDAAALLAATFTIPVRLVRPGDAVTMDLNPGRANFDIDADEVVTRAYCG